MANSTPSVPGFKPGAGAGNINLYLDLAGGEVQSAYERKTIMRERHRVFSLNGGKSLRFPRIGKASAAYHVPGTELTGGQIQNDEIVLTSDDALVADVFMAGIDEIMSNFSVRSEWMKELGRVLAEKHDANILRAVVKAARTADLLGAGAATPVSDQALASNAQKLFDAISKAKETMDIKNVDVSQDVYAVLPTASWYLMARSDKNLNRDYNGGDATLRKFTLQSVDGIEILKSNIMPFGVNDTSNTAIPARYRANYTNTVGAVWTKNAVATAEVEALEFQTVNQPEKRGTLLYAAYTSGTDVFRAAEAVELVTTA
ncbi:hypothetical protein E4M02_04265 [Brevundimonas sp. S30B]|uniref:phage capsid protein n=1 Tax=unclassified Brevundimonas TaxID=2622653 RepID=UPI001072187C|nr:MULTISPECIES: phage capsid protein [unclassified Brevundimonas]QBX36913.1 hypothetical protein E4M01_03550 [Brevundimonas sp. MF30-B]TFW04292.1 hypothetical protein E4M02_04265 [Brevundimonas sp. S30B]